MQQYPNPNPHLLHTLQTTSPSNLNPSLAQPHVCVREKAWVEGMWCVFVSVLVLVLVFVFVFVFVCVGVDGCLWSWIKGKEERKYNTTEDNEDTSCVVFFLSCVLPCVVLSCVVLSSCLLCFLVLPCLVLSSIRHIFVVSLPVLSLTCYFSLFLFVFVYLSTKAMWTVRGYVMTCGLFCSPWF